ncbi:hypothetical protein [Niveibacterium umoris]|nr:hypothetical protein [Niveibacterium umoris]
MQLRTTAFAVVICAIMGGAVAAFSPVKWLAASLWAAAALHINGSVAAFEDSRPGGFENPDGSQSFEACTGQSVGRFWLQTIVVTLGAIAGGCYVQFG